MVSSFRDDARVVQCSSVRRSDRRLCLLWPAWAYRVVAPIQQMRGLDLFERVVLGLCQSGTRSPEHIAQRVHLHPRLCAHILDRAVRAGHLNKDRELTEAGGEALRRGAVTEDPDWQVRYVFQDPFSSSGELWPRTVDRLTDAYVLNADGTKMLLQLGTAGNSDKTWARLVTPPDTAPPPPPPGPVQVLAAANEDREDRRVEQVREFERRNNLDPVAAPNDLVGPYGPGAHRDEAPELHRISFLDRPEPVFLVCFIEVATSKQRRMSSEGWIAHDPFGVGQSDMLRSLIGRFTPDTTQVGREIREHLDAEITRVGQRYRQVDREMRDAIEARLVHEFGPAIRNHVDAYELMMDVELAMQRIERDEAIEKVAQASLRLNEELLRRMARSYPVPDRVLNGTDASEQVRREALERTAHELGFHALTAFYTRSVGQLKDTKKKLDRGFVKELFALCLLAAGSGAHPEHPLRRMADQRPDLPNALQILNDLRNRAAHGGRDATASHDAKWCRSMAVEAARELLLLPV